MRLKKLFLAPVLLAPALLIASPAQAEPTDQDQAVPLEAGWYVVNEAGDVFYPGQSEMSAGEAAGDEVSPLLLDPFDWVQCWTFNNDTHVIDSYPLDWNGGRRTMALQCGFDNATTGQGYHHIRVRHEAEWRERIVQTGISNPNTDPWDDLMWFTAYSSLDFPHDESGPVNGKLCRSTKMQMHRTDTMQHVYTFYPTFQWSLTNDRLITAYPTTTSDCNR